jgi:hypothetical protein
MATTMNGPDCRISVLRVLRRRPARRHLRTIDDDQTREPRRRRTTMRRHPVSKSAQPTKPCTSGVQTTTPLRAGNFHQHRSMSTIVKPSRHPCIFLPDQQESVINTAGMPARRVKMITAAMASPGPRTSKARAGASPPRCLKVRQARQSWPSQALLPAPIRRMYLCVAVGQCCSTLRRIPKGTRRAQRVFHYPRNMRGGGAPSEVSKDCQNRRLDSGSPGPPAPASGAGFVRRACNFRAGRGPWLDLNHALRR